MRREVHQVMGNYKFKKKNEFRGTTRRQSREIEFA